MVYSVEGEFQAIRDTEFVEYVVQVIFNGLFRDKKLLADFLVAEALGNELDNFFLAIGKQRLFTAGSRFGRFRKGFHDFRGHAVIEPNFTGVNSVNTLNEKIGGRLLEDNATSAEAHGANNIAIIFCGGEYDDAGRDGIEINFFKHGETIFIGHAKIEEQDIGFKFGEELDAFGTVLRFADDSDFFVAIEQFAQAVAKNRVVVCH